MVADPSSTCLVENNDGPYSFQGKSSNRNKNNDRNRLKKALEKENACVHYPKTQGRRCLSSSSSSSTRAKKKLKKSESGGGGGGAMNPSRASENGMNGPPLQKKKKNTKEFNSLNTNQRLLVAKDRRLSEQRRRMEALASLSEAKTNAALERAENHIRAKVTQANNRCLDRISKVRNNRVATDARRRIVVEISVQKRTEDAKRRAELTLRRRKEKARWNVDQRVTEVRSRRFDSDSRRTQSLQSTIQERSKNAVVRARGALDARRHGGRHAESRAQRAKARRDLMEYERRSALLSSLDGRVERAHQNRQRTLNGRILGAKEEILRAREVSRRVRAARTIQQAVRYKLFHHKETIIFKSTRDRQRNNHRRLGLGQNAAAIRLQMWKQWREKIVIRRMLQPGEHHALTHHFDEILSIRPSDNSLSFEDVRKWMTKPKVLQAAKWLIHCFLPLLVHSFSNDKYQEQWTKLNDRTLLSVFLVAKFPNDVLSNTNNGGNENKVNSAVAKASIDAVKSLQKLASTFKRFAKTSKKITSKTNRTTTSPPKRLATTMAKHNKSSNSININGNIRNATSCLVSYSALFDVWKNADLDDLITGMTQSAEQAWREYLKSSEALKYIEQHQEDTDASTKKTHSGALYSIRLHHDASKSGAMSHIKRIRLAMNRLVGKDEGLRIMKGAKKMAQEKIDMDDVLIAIEADVKAAANYGNRPQDPNIHASFITNEEPPASMEPDTKDNSTASIETTALLSNRHLVHNILLTHPADLDKLKVDGNLSEKEDVVDVNDFMTAWTQNPSNENTNMAAVIAQTVERAFHNRIIEDLRNANFKTAHDMISDLMERARGLVPNRSDIHEALANEMEKVQTTETIGSLLQILLKFAQFISTDLEAASRVSSTMEWIDHTTNFLEQKQTSNGVIPFGLRTTEEFTVASVAFLFLKLKVCYEDVANFNLRQTASLFHQHHSSGDFAIEFDNFHAVYGPLDLSSIDSIKTKLPATHAWINAVVTSLSNTEVRVGDDCLNRNSDNNARKTILKNGLVDSLLFSKNTLEIPEFLDIDRDHIRNIRREAQFAVVGSALLLHACNVGRINRASIRRPPTAASSSSPSTFDIQRDKVSAALRAVYSNDHEFVKAMSEVIHNFTEVVGEQKLDNESKLALQSFVGAVLRGEDPVLKLLDNRIRQFFRYICQWDHASDTNTSSQSNVKLDASIASPVVPMRTGREVIMDKNNNTFAKARKKSLSLLKQQKENLKLAAEKEASKLGFASFLSPLVEAGLLYRSIARLACEVYGDNILDPLMKDALKKTST